MDQSKGKTVKKVVQKVIKSKRNFKNPPLKEAIFELRWDVSKVDSEIKKDSQIIAGIFSDKIKKDYPYHEPLDASKIPVPEEALNGVVQHRFRIGEDKWPLIQMGPGVFTVNDTSKDTAYEWKDFKTRCVNNARKFLNIYPVMDYVESITLRYVNAIPFNYEKENIFDFLKEKMNVEVSLPEDFFVDTKLEVKPLNFNLAFVHACTKPAGLLKLVLVSGKDGGNDALVFNIDFIANNPNIPDLTDEGLKDWLEITHTNIEAIFFTLVDKLKDELK